MQTKIMKNVMKTMKVWLLRWLSPKAAETAKAESNDSHIINKVERVESEKRVERGNNIDCSPIEHDQLFAQLCKAYPQVMRGITAHALSRSLTALGILPRHTRKGNVYHLVPITTP